MRQTKRVLRVGLTALVLLMAIVGCAGSEKKSEAAHESRRLDANLPAVEEVDYHGQAAPAPLVTALKSLEDGDNQSALDGFEAYLNVEPTTKWTQSILFNEGRALEGLGQWAEAAEKYSHVIASLRGTAPKLEALALYRLSFCHESLGDEQAALVDLHDLITRANALSPEVRSAELPARLAGGYAKVGNFDEAVRYYEIAEVGIAKLRRSSSLKGAIPSWLPQTLFEMGDVSSRNISWQDFEIVLRPLAKSQIYLLEAAELGVKPWSEKAATNLIETYAALWNVIMHPPDEHRSVPEKRELQELQIRRADLLLRAEEDLRARALATESKQGSSESKQALASITAIGERVRRLYDERPAGTGPTSEALARQAGLRGKVVAPMGEIDDSLERKFLRSAHPSVTLPTKLKKKSSAPPSEDPNL